MSAIPTETTVTRAYRGKPAAAAVLFQADAAFLAQHGYVPVNQSYVPGRWHAGVFILAVLLAIAFVGILILIYLIVVKPEGTLMVTYEKRLAVPL